MTFSEAVALVRTRHVMVTRPSWNIFCAIRLDHRDTLGYWELDNCDGGWSGNGWPNEPTDEDRAATDWMLYQALQENWSNSIFDWHLTFPLSHLSTRQHRRWFKNSMEKAAVAKPS